MHYRALPPASSYNFRSAIASEEENGVTRSHGRMMNSVKGGKCVSKGASKNEIVQRSVRIGAVRRQKGVCERKDHVQTKDTYHHIKDLSEAEYASSYHHP